MIPVPLSLLNDIDNNDNSLIQNCLLFDMYEKISTKLSGDLAKEFPNLILLLEACHQQNIIHRDIHPSNILVNRKTNKIELLLNDWSSSIRLNEENEIDEEIEIHVITNDFVSDELLYDTKEGDLVMAVNSIYYLCYVDYHLMPTKEFWKSINHNGYVESIEHATNGEYSKLYDSIRKLVNESNNNANSKKRISTEKDNESPNKRRKIDITLTKKECETNAIHQIFHSNKMTQKKSYIS